MGADPGLADRLGGLVAVAGGALDVLPGLPAGWSRAPGVALVLVAAGADIPPERRQGVVLVCGREPGAPAWRQAVELGAEEVVVLPAGEPWLLDRVLDAVTPSGRAPVVGLIGGRGGAGASTLAVGLAGVAARSGVPSLLVDADPLGGGADLLLGVEHEPGLRWGDLAGARGRLQPGTLPRMLPAAGDLAVLSWGRAAERPGTAPSAWDAGWSARAWPDGEGAAGGRPESPPPGATLGGPEPAGGWPDPAAVDAVLGSAVRDFALVVVDLSRRFGPGDLAALRRCSSVFVVVPAEVRAAAAAAAVCTLLEPVVADLRLVVRGPAPTGLPAEAVAEALGLPLAGELRSEPGVAAALDRGDCLPDRPRGALATLSRRLVAQVLAA